MRAGLFLLTLLLTTGSAHATALPLIVASRDNLVPNTLHRPLSECRAGAAHLPLVALSRPRI